MSESRHLHHQRSSSTGSHGLFFNNVSHQLSHGVNSFHHQSLGHHHVGHHILHHQASGSPDLLSELSDDDDSNDRIGTNSAPELQGILSFSLVNFKVLGK